MLGVGEIGGKRGDLRPERGPRRVTLNDARGTAVPAGQPNTGNTPQNRPAGRRTIAVASVETVKWLIPRTGEPR